MSEFDSRNTPVVGSPGAEVAELPGTTELLSSLVTVPATANAALVQGVGDLKFAFRLDGTEGESSNECLSATTHYLSNREIIANMVVCANGGATDIVVQWYTGRTGPAYR